MANKTTRRSFIKTTAALSAGLLTGCRFSNRFDIIIKSGWVYDGTGAPPVLKDLGIKGDRIAAIADLENSSADLIIDAHNLAVAPGFIDIHAHTDSRLLVCPEGDSKIYQGVTTEIGGNCGSSPFPLNDEDFHEMHTSSVEKYGIEFNWRKLDGFFQALEERKMGINYATFTGHGDLRAFVVGKNDVPATPEQLNRMQAILAESMEHGSLGLSTGLEYAPGSYASAEELIELCKIVSKRNGVYATHMRNEDDRVLEAITEALRICTEAGVSTELSHFKACNKSNWPKKEKMLEMLHNAHDAGLPVHADRYPYIAYSTGLAQFLPLSVRQGSDEEVLARLKDAAFHKVIKEYAQSRSTKIGGWDRVVIASCKNPEDVVFEGKSLLQCAEEKKGDPLDVVIELLIRNDKNVDIVGFAMDEDNLRKTLQSNLMMIGSDGSVASVHGKLSAGKPHPRFYGTFPRVLGRYCREGKWFDLQTALKKMTSMPAEKLGLKGRGKIQKNYFADITIFDPQTIIDKATFSEPHQYPAGIEYVLVSGQLTIDKGKHLGKYAGHVLKI